MEVQLISAFTTVNLPHFPLLPLKFPIKHSFLLSFSSPPNKFTFFNPWLSLAQQNSTAPLEIITALSKTASNSITSDFTASDSSKNFHWMVLIDKPSPNVIDSKPQLVNYYVTVLQKVLGSDEKNAQRCIYDVCCDKTNFGFCCFVDEQTSHVIAGIPDVLAVKPDPDISSVNKDYRYNFNLESSASLPTQLLFPGGWKHWLVCVEKPPAKIFSKSQMVDFYVDILTKVLGNKKVAQMCLYHTSWQSNYGFCCMLDDKCAQVLAAVPGVLSIQPDENFESENKNYGGGRLSSDALSSAGTDTSKTKLFVTGLSFYTSEKTLCAAFEPFGELVEVKVIMDKISKRSKGYAFIEYTTEDATTTALREMNGKIINGWMITVDSAKNKPRFGRGP